jgi:Flp pilus assembly protein TadG
MEPKPQKWELSPETRMAADAGQSAISLAFILNVFLLGMLGFSVDLTNVWSHRQAAVAAADAACQAGAMDQMASAAGETLTTTGFTAGTASNCVNNPSATMCFYANQNGYNGTGLVSGSASNAVSWTFPSTVSGVTPGAGTYPFLQVSIAENVKTYLMGMVKGSHYVTVNVTSTCGDAQVMGAAPMIVLNPTVSGAFTYSGGGLLDIVGGPSRGLQVNSSSSTAVSWQASASINLSGGGANETGSSAGIVGGPTAVPNNGSSSGFSGGTTGQWETGVLPVPDPYASVPVPTSVASLTPANTTSGKWVAFGVDGCADNSGATGNASEACLEFSPGYYPSGIDPLDYITAIFLPGVYYMNGSLVGSGSGTLRVAKPSGYQQTDGVMFYFFAGSFNVSGCSGCANSKITNVNATDLTCDGSSPPAALGMPSTLSGNVLYGMCATNGTYFDSGGDTSDTRGTPGSRGLLFYQAHANTTQPTFSGSGALTFAGALYFHSNAYGDILNISGGASSGTFILGEIVVDEVNLSGSGAIRLALSSADTTPLSKVGVFN